MKPIVELQTYSKRLQNRIYELEVEKKSFHGELKQLKAQVERLSNVHMSLIEEVIRLQRENAELKSQLCDQIPSFNDAVAIVTANCYSRELDQEEE